MQEISAHCTSHNRGFTLLELLIVCLLISITLAFSIPSLRNSLVSDQLAAGSRKVISLVRSSRARAVAEQKDYLILYDSEERKLWYRQAEEEEDQGNRGSSGSVTLPSDVSIQKVKQAGGGSEQNPLNTGIWVSKEGYMDKTLIQLEDSEDNSLNLLISPFLPTITVSTGPVSFP